MQFHGPFRKEFMKKYDEERYLFEVKLFSNKEEMIQFVNELKQIENVEITKIEESLYKVLIIRRKQKDKVEL
ncbi:MAG: hypothetical protein CVV61_04665 [Tenericutes bacterium HGW-Tenericutes-6]|nr:MAG: hypothetical protein CVV61_04665 [Tenericutes bacterium HGW-Tenericutes-6]